MKRFHKRILPLTLAFALLCSLAPISPALAAADEFDNFVPGAIESDVDGDLFIAEDVLEPDFVIFEADDDPIEFEAAAYNPSIPTPSGGTVDTSRKLVRVSHTWLTAANYLRWATNYIGADGLSIWYTNDGSDPYQVADKPDSTAKRCVITYPLNSGVLGNPLAYIDPHDGYTGGTTYKFVCYNGADYGGVYTYTSAVTAPILEIDNQIRPEDTTNVTRLTSGLYKRSDVENGIRLWSGSGAAKIYYQTAPCLWDPSISQFTASTVDNLAAAALQNDNNLYTGPISAANVNATNAIAIRAITVLEGLAASAAVTFKVRVCEDEDFIELKADKDGNLLVDLDAFIAQLTVEEKLMICGGVGGDPIWLQNGFNETNGEFEFNNGGTIHVGGPAGGTPTIPRFNIPSTGLADGPAGVRMWKNATIWMCPAGVGAAWNAGLTEQVGRRYAEEAKYYAIDYVLGPGVNNQRNPLSGRNFEYFSEDPLILGNNGAMLTKGMNEGGVGGTLKHYAANDYETGRSNQAYATERALREIYLRAFEIAIKKGDPWCVMTGYNGINGTSMSRNTWGATTLLRDEWGFDGFVMTDWGGDSGTASLEAQVDMSQSGARTLATYVTWLNANMTRNMGYLNRSTKNILKVLVKTFAFQGEYGVLQPDGSYADGFKLNGEPTTGLTRADISNRNVEFGASDVQKISRVINKQVADEAIVLLENKNDILPLRGNEKIALVSSRNAWKEFFDPRWYGDSASIGDLLIQGTGSAQVRFNNNGTEDYAMTLQEALESRGFSMVDWQIDYGAYGGNNDDFLNSYYNHYPVHGSKKYIYSQEQAQGQVEESAAFVAAMNVSLADGQANAKAAAEAAAKSAEVGIFIITRVAGEGADMSQNVAFSTARVPSNAFNMEARELIVYEAYEKAFRDAGKPLIVMINVGGTINTTPFRGGSYTATSTGTGGATYSATTQGCDAILDVWNPGSAGSEAIADILKGAVNPSGKLAESFPVDFNDSPSVYMFSEVNAKRREQGLAAYPGNGYNNAAYYADGVYVGYRFYESRPELYETMVAYPFGYGLSYTKFEFSNFNLSKNYISSADDTITASVTVKNVGKVAGKEVVQLYLNANTWQEEGRPKNELRAYGKTELLYPGESETIQLTISYEDLRYFDDKNPSGMIPTNYSATVMPNYIGESGWTVADGTIFTATIRTNDCDADKPNQPIKGLTESFYYTETPVGSIVAPVTLDLDESRYLTYTVNIGNVFGANMFDIEANFDASKLTYEDYSIELPKSLFPGSLTFGESYKASTGKFTLSIGLMGQYLALNTEEQIPLVKIRFRVKDGFDYGNDVTGALVSVKTYIPGPDRSYQINVDLDPDTATTSILSSLQYDTDGDGKITMNDVSYIIFNYYLAAVGDYNWNEAKRFDTNGDGFIDLSDIMYIISLIK